MIVCTSVILVVISPLPFLIIFIWVLSLFLSVILAKGFSVFKNMFRKPALSFLDLSYCFLSSILFISVVIFLFFSTSLFAHLFLISLDIRLDYLFEVFLFLKVAVSLRTSLLDLFFFFFGCLPKILESCVSIFSHIKGLTWAVLASWLECQTLFSLLLLLWTQRK